MRRRTLLVLPGLAGLGAVMAACAGGPAPAAVPNPTDGGRVPEPRRIAYGEDPSQYGELHLPAGEPVATAVVVHGGFWKAEYGLEYGTPLAVSLAQHGWAAWNIEYRRVGNGGGVPQTLDDVTAALAQVPRLGLPDAALRTVVGVGHSAGGHLATWAGAGGVLTHVVSQAGVLDLGAAAAEGLGGGAVQAFLGHAPTAADGDVDPVRMVPLAVPVWCVHGDADDIVPISQSESYVRAATAAGARAELVRVSGDHFALIDPANPAWTRVLRILDGLA